MSASIRTASKPTSAKYTNASTPSSASSRKALISKSTSTQYDDLFRTNPNKIDLLDDETRHLDLSLIFNVERQVAEIVSLLADPTILVEGLRPTTRALQAHTVRTPSTPSQFKTSKMRMEHDAEQRMQFLNRRTIPYKELFENSAEYVGLFKVNRPMQSDVSTIKDVRGTEEAYTDLQEDIQEIIEELQQNFDGGIAKAIQTLSAWSRLLDMVARVAHQAELDLQDAIKKREAEHAAKLVEMDKKIYQAKKDAHQRGHETSKLRSQCSRYQVMLRKHGLSDHDEYLTVGGDEKVRTGDIIEYYQTSQARKESKIQDMTTQLQTLEDIAEQLYKAAKEPLVGDGTESNLKRQSNLLSAREAAKPAKLGSLDSELAKSSESAFSAFSAFSAATAATSLSRGGAAARNQPRRTYMSDLSSVMERKAGLSVMQRAPRTPRNNSLMENQDVEVGRTSRMSSIKGGVIMGGDIVTEEGEDNRNGYEECPLSEEEQLNISLEIREIYETKLRKLHHECETNIEQQRGEMMRMNREFQDRFEEVRRAMAMDMNLKYRLGESQKPALTLMRQLFPRGTVPGKANVAVQCDIEPTAPPAPPATATPAVPTISFQSRRKLNEQQKFQSPSKPDVRRDEPQGARILVDMIRAVQPSSRWKVVVIDSESLKLLNNCCKMHDVLEENVTLIEDISRKRTSYPTKDAIYFITPCNESVSALVDDFSKGKPMYASAHVYFTSMLSDSLFAKIKGAPTVGEYIKTLSELNIDFLPIEHQVFSVDQPQALYPIFNPVSPASRQSAIEHAAKRLISLFSTIGELPYIRYFDPTAEKKSPSFLLAQSLQNELDELCKLDPDFPPKTHFKRPTLIIVDRSFDVMAPLLHEFTYQAMMNDLLVMDNGKYVYQTDGGMSPALSTPSSVASAPSPSSASQKATLDEADPIWMLLRHWHFAEAVEYIRDNFNRFLSANKAAVQAIGHEGGAATGMDSLAQMKDTLTSLPEFQEMKAKFSIHINICQECKLIFERRKLDSVASVEQDLATGETADGKVPRNVMMDLVPLLDDPAMVPYDKLRLLMLYIIAQEGIQDADRRRLLEVSKLQVEDSQAITNLNYFGVRLSVNSDKKSARNLKDKYGYYGRLAEKKRKKKKKADDEVPYDLSRYVPLLKYVLEDQVAGLLEVESFPYIKDAPADEHPPAKGDKPAPKSNSKINPALIPNPNASNPFSLRTTKPSWAVRPRNNNNNGGSGGGMLDGSGGGNKGEHDAEDLRKNGGRVIVFVLGGLTFSEIRSAYEVMKDSQRDILIGSTAITNPTQFINLLKDLHKSEGYHSGPSMASATSLTNLAGMQSSPASPHGSMGNVAHVSHPEAVRDDKKVGLKGLFKKK
ncbi:vacuolar sorting protein VPS33/slp1 [Chytridiales sp. JEL 0842]|nr:vacuolar sorting protein VPS33/slp1 [Chytridiales sp. JEL 0842]